MTKHFTIVITPYTAYTAEIFDEENTLIDQENGFDTEGEARAYAEDMKQEIEEFEKNG